MYYLRTRAAADAIKFTVDQQALAKNKPAAVAAAAPAPAAPQQQQQEPAAAAAAPDVSGLSHEEREAQLAAMVCSLENRDACLMCGS
jgi:hypothetical protein